MYAEILRCCQNVYDAIEDTEYPDVVFISRAMDGVGADGVDRFSTVEGVLSQNLRDLVGLGARVVVNACNTTGEAFMRLSSELTRRLGVEVVDTVGATVEALPVESRRIGLLTSRALRDSGVYVVEVERSYRTAVVLDEEHQEVLDRVIHSLMGGNQSGVSGGLESLIWYLGAGGADHVIAGCTELAGVNLNGLTRIGVTDSVVATAAAGLRLAYSGVL